MTGAGVEPPSSTSRVRDDLAMRAARHEAVHARSVREFVSLVETRYAEEVERFANRLQPNPQVAALLGPASRAVREYASWMRWVGWNVARLGPVLHADTRAGAGRLALAMLAYVPGRLVDDALDGHQSFKGHHASLVAALRGLAPGAPPHQAAVQSALVGFAMFHHALARMREEGLDVCADEAGRLFQACWVGVMAECFVGGRVEGDLYERIVERKSVAYNQILYRPFLFGVDAAVRLPLLRILSGIDHLAQLLNDCVDEEDDRRAGRMNALTHGVYDRATARAEVRRRLGELWELTSALPEDVGDAVAAILSGIAASLPPG